MENYDDSRAIIPEWIESFLSGDFWYIPNFGVSLGIAHEISVVEKQSTSILYPYALIMDFYHGNTPFLKEMKSNTVFDVNSERLHKYNAYLEQFDDNVNGITAPKINHDPISDESLADNSAFFAHSKNEDITSCSVENNNGGFTHVSRRSDTAPNCANQSSTMPLLQSIVSGHDLNLLMPHNNYQNKGVESSHCCPGDCDCNSKGKGAYDFRSEGYIITSIWAALTVINGRC